MTINIHIGNRMSLDGYQAMAADGRLTKYDRIELLNGEIVAKRTPTPLRANTICRLIMILREWYKDDPGWFIQSRLPIALTVSQPEPDLSIILGSFRKYSRRHPMAIEVALVVEVADDLLEQHQGLRQNIYAQAGVPVYWIINLTDFVVEVYSQPVQVTMPHYADVQRLRGDDMLSIILASTELCRFQVHQLFPE